MNSSLGLAALMILCGATTAAAQSDPLPGRLVGQYTVTTGQKNKINVVPVELTDINLEGDKVTGVVANYRSPNGNCVADKTPFTGTYQEGRLKIKSMPLLSQRPDGNPCGAVLIDVKVSGGRASGMYKGGPLEGPIEFEVK